MFISWVVYSQQLDKNYYVETLKSKEKDFNQTSFKYCIPDKNGIIWIGTEMGLYKYEGVYITKVTDKRFPAISTNRIVKLGKDYQCGEIIFVTYPENSVYTIIDNRIEKINYLQYPNQYLFSTNNKCLLPNNPFHKKIIDYISKRFLFQNNIGLGEKTMIKVNDCFYIIINATLLIFNKNGEIKSIELLKAKQYTAFRFGTSVILVVKGNVFSVNEIENKIFPVKTDNIIQSYLNQNNGIDNFQGIDDYNILDYNGVIYQVIFKNNKLSTRFIFKSKGINDRIFINYNKNIDSYFFKRFSSDLSIIKPLKFKTIDVNNTDKNNCYAVTISDTDNWLSASGWSYNTKNQKTRIAFDIMYNKGFILPYEGFYYTVSKNFLHNVKNQKKAGFYKPTGNTTGYTYFKNNLWISENNALYYLKDNRCEVDTFLSEKLKKLNINGIYTFNNKIVLVTNTGVFFYTPFSRLIKVKGLEKVYARYFKQIDENSFWICCYGDGLFYNQKGKCYKVKDINIDLSSPHAIEEDAEGNLWISTNFGLLTVNKKTAIKNIQQNKPIECYRFTTDDGLPTNEFNGGGTNPSLKDKNGVIGFPTVKGFVWFEPSKVKKHLFSERIIIDKVREDGKNVYFKKNKYNIEPKTKMVSIDISFAYYFNRENIVIEYRFADKPTWQKTTSNSFQILRESDGKRKLFIRIHTHGFDAENDVVKTVFLDFKPRYYETAWFWTLVLLLSATLLYLAFRLGLQINKRRERLLENKVEIKTLELQKTVSELDISRKEISKSLQEKELLIKEIHHRVKNNLQLVITLLSYQSSRFQSKELNDFLESGAGRIVSMALIHENLYQSENLGFIDFKEYSYSLIRNIIVSMADDKDVDYLIDVDEIIFDIRVAIPLGLIINELIVNTIKHNYKYGNTLYFSLHLKEISSKNYKLTYKDPQSIMTPNDSKKTSFGLELIQLLASQLKSKCELSFSDGLMVTIEFKAK